MLQDLIHPPEQLPILNEELSSPITSQMFDFSDHGLYPDALRSSDVSSTCSGGYCNYDDNSYGPDPAFSSFSSFPPDHMIKLTNTTNDTSINNNGNNNSNNSSNNNSNNLSILLDTQQDAETDLTTSLSSILTPPHIGQSISLPSYISNQHDQLDLLSLQSQILLSADAVNPNGFSPYSPDSVEPLATQMSLPAVLDEDCLCPLPPYVCLDPSSPPSSSFMDQPGMVVGGYMAGNLNGGMSMDAHGMFSGNVVMDSGLQSQELEFQGENGGVYSSDSVYSSGEIMALNESHHQQQQQQMMVSGGAPPLTSDISTFEDPAFKVGRLSVEERKEKIHRYMKKRNERNFTKKIKYACRKTLADSRPRVRGRFAKNDEFGEATRPSSSNHEDEDDEEVGVKEEEEMIDSADIFAHISGVNSFKCNYPTQTWM